MVANSPNSGPQRPGEHWGVTLRTHVERHEPPTIPLDRLFTATVAVSMGIGPEEQKDALSRRAGYARLCTEVACATDESERMDAICRSILRTGLPAHREFLGLLLTYSPDFLKREEGIRILLTEGAPSAYAAGVRLMRSRDESQPTYAAIVRALDLISLENDLGIRTIAEDARDAIARVKELGLAVRRTPAIPRSSSESSLEKFVAALATGADLDKLRAAAVNLTASGHFPEFREASAGYIFADCGKEGPTREDFDRLDTILRAGTLADVTPNGMGTAPSAGKVLQFPAAPDVSQLAADTTGGQHISDPAGGIGQIAWTGTRPPFLTILEEVPAEIRAKILPRVVAGQSATSVKITFAPDRGFDAPVRPFYQGVLPTDSVIGRFKQNLVTLADAGFGLGDCRDRRSWGVTKEGTIVCLDWRSLRKLDSHGIADEKARIAEIRTGLL